MGHSNGEAKPMTPTYNWVGRERNDGGIVLWKLFIDRQLRYSLTYLGLTRRANWADRKQRWKAQDHRDVEGTNDIPEFNSLDEAKAWVTSIITLE